MYRRMSEQPPEFSESGQPIYRHKPRQKPFEIAIGDPQHIQLIESHIAKHMGQPDSVFHEVISDLVHVDVHFVPSGPNRNFHTLVTGGMSARAMNAPAGHEDFSYAELFICLPANWPVREQDFKVSRNSWPLRLIKYLARMPHEYDTFLASGHTVPNGVPPEPFAAKTQFCCALIAPTRLAPKEFGTLTVSPEMKIHFYAVVPLYKEEMDLKLKSGVQALYERFDRYGISELLDIKRRNVAKKVFGIF
jgi:Suppressor of fused protein (SUFU)